MLNWFSKFNFRTSQLIALNLKHMVLLAYLDTLKSGKAVQTIVLEKTRNPLKQPGSSV